MAELGLEMNITRGKKLKEIRVRDIGRFVSVDIEITKNYGESNSEPGIVDW